MNIRRGLRWLRGERDETPDAGLSRRRAILLRGVYPPDRPADAVGHLGGLPELPPGIEWPRHARSGAPMTFLAAIDLARLPVPGEGPALPREGALLFFAAADGEDWCDDGETPMGQVVFLPDGLRAPERAPPADAPPCYGGSWMHYFKRLDSEADVPRSFDRWAIEARAVDSFCTAMDDDPARAGEREEEAARRNVEAALDAYGRKPPNRRYHEDIDLLPPEPYPQFWRMIEAAAGGVRFGAHFKLEIDPISQPSETARPAYVQARDEAAEWAAEARARDPWEEPSPEDRRRFRDWIDELDDRYYAPEEYAPFQKDVVHLVHANVLLDSMSESIDELMALDPARLRAAMPDAERLVAWRHAVVIDELGTMVVVAHQMLGWGAEVQDVVHQHQDDVLLLQLASDHGIRWAWGDCGVIQFWISPDDLAARRFDRVVTTFAGH